MRTQEERDRQTVGTAMRLPLVVLAIVACAPIIGAAAELGVLPILILAYFTLALLGVARRDP